MDYLSYGLFKDKQFEWQQEIRMWFLVDLKKLSAPHHCRFFERKFDPN